jgi:hypothetical protein
VWIGEQAKRREVENLSASLYGDTVGDSVNAGWHDLKKATGYHRVHAKRRFCVTTNTPRRREESLRQLRESRLRGLLDEKMARPEQGVGEVTETTEAMPGYEKHKRAGSFVYNTPDPADETWLKLKIHGWIIVVVVHSHAR